MIAAFAVGIPARDEADHVATTIAALAEAARLSPHPVHAVVTADSCTDATAAAAAAAIGAAGRRFTSAGVRPVTLGTAGAARDAACRAALGRATAGGVHPDEVWVATTDADSTVPPAWFVRHDQWARRGLHGVAGLVELSETEPLSARARRRWRDLVQERGVELGHPHVHGANLGMRGDVWLSAGGFAALAVGEDHHLWDRARALGAVLLGTPDLIVRTAARTTGRTPGGLAGLLAELER